MALTVTHTFVSAKLDGADTTLLQPSDWNAAHTVAGEVLTRTGTTLAPTTAGDSLSVPGGTPALLNEYLGARAGESESTGSGNVAVGYYALGANTAGNANTAVGLLALAAQRTDNGTAVGAYALMSATTGAANTAVGRGALTLNTTGYDNTAVGYQALATNVLGHANTALGSNALSAYAGAALDGSVTAVGYHALMAMATGRYVTAVGSFAGVALTGDGLYNTAVGHAALLKATTGERLTAVGDYAASECVTGSGLVALGAFAGKYETGSDAFYVDNQDRTNTAGDKAGALLYGTFHATPASQTLKINAAVTIGTIPAFVAGDKYLVVDASGNIHVSGLGPAS